MIETKAFKGTQENLAEELKSYFNNESVDVLNVYYAVAYEDIFHTEAIHHAIVCYKEKDVS